MKKYLKVTAAVLAAVIMLALAACGAENTADNVLLISLVYENGAPATTAAPVPSGGTPATTAAPAPSGDTPATTAAPAPSGDTPATTAAPAPSGDTPAPSGTGMPSGVADILEFYRKAVKRVKNGEAGYNKKSWQTIPELNLTGNASIDKQVVNIASGYMTSEDKAETEVNAKGSGDATGRMPDCTLTDLSKIKSADCVADGSNYKVTIVMNDEIAPDAKDASYIAQISDNLAYKADIDKELGGISILKDPDYVITYTNFTITATITPDGQFVSMTHHNDTKIHINSAKILFITLSDKDITMTADTIFNTFVY